MLLPVNNEFVFSFPNIHFFFYLPCSHWTPLYNVECMREDIFVLLVIIKEIFQYVIVRMILLVRCLFLCFLMSFVRLWNICRAFHHGKVLLTLFLYWDGDRIFYLYTVNVMMSMNCFPDVKTTLFSQDKTI